MGLQLIYLVRNSNLEKIVFLNETGFNVFPFSVYHNIANRAKAMFYANWLELCFTKNFMFLTFEA